MCIRDSNCGGRCSTSSAVCGWGRRGFLERLAARAGGARGSVRAGRAGRARGSRAGRRRPDVG
eukprot:14673018-Alexandrium_andersonii.AAC.1